MYADCALKTALIAYSEWGGEPNVSQILRENRSLDSQGDGVKHRSSLWQDSSAVLPRQMKPEVTRNVHTNQFHKVPWALVLFW